MRLQKITSKFQILGALICLSTFFSSAASAQVEMPKPGNPRAVKIPTVSETELPNGLTVATVERKNVPLVTVQLLIRIGADSEGFEKAGLANLTASLLTKGTKLRNANQISNQMEFLGSSLFSGADWNNSFVGFTVSADKLNQAMAIMADSMLNARFDQKELDLLKSQSLDGLTYNLKQPGFLTNYVASRYSFDEYPVQGTPESIRKITRREIVQFKNTNYRSSFMILIFSGDITAQKANNLARTYFGNLKPFVPTKFGNKDVPSSKTDSKTLSRLLVVDLPDSGQASVSYSKQLLAMPRSDKKFFLPATVLNSVLGGGYSSRLNQEIRIKRGLSYGAGSSFAWRFDKANFATRTQTKNESAAEVAELVVTEIEKLTQTEVSESELNPRKLVLTGDFGRDLETTFGMGQSLAELYGFYLSTNELNEYVSNINGVKAPQIKEFAKNYLKGGDLIIVGDYAKFKEDLAKRFPNLKPEVIKADNLDLSKLSSQ